jgi:negative regulator of sigma E activity
LRAQLAANPDARADWEMESALNAALTQLPDASMPSNFTARVLQAVEREEARPRVWSWRWNWHTLVPRVAFAAAVIAFTGLAFQHHEIYRQRTALAKNVALVTRGPTDAQPGSAGKF